ncbi:transcription factor TCP14-like [Hibiscus syriacus]|uniref:Transcription factor TCP14-like n=1 Tax=Hibiscus syriacus TaxID=106335 RepID=A0A6A2ZHI0_HIBSY|nr:transcription factor TCP14-like [Hibiscus syriacus]
MKETETVKEYTERLLSIANQVRLLGSSLEDSRIVEKILVTLPEIFEAIVTTLENTKDLSKIPLAELLSALQAQEQRREMRQEGTIEGSLAAKHHNNGKNKNESNESWLIDSGSTNHMTHDKELFRDLKPTNITKVRIGNGDYISVKGNGTIAIFKSEVAQVFWKFKEKVENESGCKIHIVRSDNGKEYTSAKFDKFCEDSGIEHQLTAPYTPQQNGVSERRNKYIMEMSRCMLHEKNLPKKFWAEIENIVVFLQNRLPTKAVKEHTPFEACKRDKLDRRASPGMLTLWRMKSGAGMMQRRMVDSYRKVIGVKWVFRTKFNADGSINKHKARLLVKGYAQIFGVDYSDTFAPVLDWTQSGNNIDHIQIFKQEMMKVFEMIDLGFISYFLGMEIKQGKGEVFICQKKYAKEILKKSLISCLMYLTATRPDILNDSSKKQEIVAQSTAEAEFIITTAIVNKALWLRNILLDLDLKQKERTKIFVDNQVAIAISHNPMFHGNTKHFNIKLIFLREVQNHGDVILVYCKTEDQVAQILTKPLSAFKFEFLRSRLGVCSS